MKKIFSAILSVLLIFILVALTSVQSVAETGINSIIDENVWCFIGKFDGTSCTKTFTKDDYPNASDALQTAFDYVAKNGGCNDSVNGRHIVINQDMTISKTVTASSWIHLDNRYYTLTSIVNGPAIQGEDTGVYLYGQTDETAKGTNSNKFVASKGCPFFKSLNIQGGGYFNGDLIVEDCRSFKTFYKYEFWVISGKLEIMTSATNLDSSGISVEKFEYSTVTDSDACLEFAKTVTYLEPTEIDGLNTDAMETGEGAQIRLGKLNGMRFHTTVNDTSILKNTSEYGTIIAPLDLIGRYLTIEDVNDRNAIVVKYNASKLWNDNLFVGSIVNLKTKNLNRKFIARAYYVANDEYYYSKTTTVRTIADIADAYINDKNSGYTYLDEELKLLVDSWAIAND